MITSYVIRLHGPYSDETWAEATLPAAVTTAYTVVRAAGVMSEAEATVSIAQLTYDERWQLVSERPVLAATGLADLRHAVTVATGNRHGR